MSNEASIEFTGFAGGEPETKEFNDGSVTTVSVAVTPSNRLQDGSYKDRETQWYRVKASNKTAASQFAHIHKGTKLLINGQINGLSTYQAGDGSTRMSVNVGAHVIGIIQTTPKRQQSGYAPAPAQTAQRPQQAAQSASDPWGSNPDPYAEQDFGRHDDTPEF